MRDKRVSISKGICIILMVYCHAGCMNFLHDFIYMFHMPLFFFMSGYCFKEKYRTNVLSFMKNKVRGIWWPYVKWVSIFVLLHNLFLRLGVFYEGFVYRNVTMRYYSMSEICLNLLNTLRFCHGELLLAGFWFLFTLFGASIIFIFLIKTIKDLYWAAAVVFCLMLIFKSFSFSLPFLHLGDKELQATFFMFIGYMFKCNQMANGILSSFITKRIVVLILVALVIVGSVYFPSQMIKLDIKTIVPYTLFAIPGILMVMSLASFILKNNMATKVLMYIGDNTLPILVWHFSLFKVVSAFLIIAYGLDFKNLSDFPTIQNLSMAGWNIVYTLVAVVLSLVLANLSDIKNIRNGISKYNN